MSTVVLLGTLDTKRQEIEFAARTLQDAGVETVLVDISTRDPDSGLADVGPRELASAAGRELDLVWADADRRERQELMVAGATAILRARHDAGGLDGVMALGGSNNTAMAAEVFRALPIGLPKLILTTMAGDVGRYVGASDLMIAPSVVDVAGLNRLTRVVIANAAAAVAGMVTRVAGAPPSGDGPVVACSMIGLTSAAVSAAREQLEGQGYEVVVFHMTGRGGLAMESYIAGGAVAGVLDLTTSELADDLFGGVCSAGPERLRAAARLGLPQVVAPGGLDMINFGAPESVPTRLRDRRLQAYNAQVTLVRTSVEECAQLGHELVERLTGVASSAGAGRRARTVVVLPQDGLSAIDRPGGPFFDPAATAALREAVHAEAQQTALTVTELPGDLDQPSFGRRAATLLHELIAAPAPALSSPSTH